MSEVNTIDIEIELLIQAVYQKFQYDFRSYSRSSLRRRLSYALVRMNLDSVSQLLHKLLHEEDFFPKLLDYLVVNTTEMFRDPEYFLSLKNNVFPFLRTFPSVKVWIAGCSTGEELYSLAILMREAQFKRVMFYATDINPHNLEMAQRGIYDAEAIKKASKNYQLSGGQYSLSDYYEAAYNSVKFDPTLIENVVFSDHSLATDSVFSEMHLISCRNVLIYFERDLQDRVFNLFSGSLIRDCFLGIGNKETLQFSSSQDDFSTVDSKNRIYQKRTLV